MNDGRVKTILWTVYCIFRGVGAIDCVSFFVLGIQVRNRLSLSRLHCKTWHFIKVFYLTDERHFVYLMYKCILIFQVKYLLYSLCFIKIIFLLTGNIATFSLPVIDHKAFLSLMTLSSINLRTYKVIALVNKKLIIATPLKLLKTVT